MNSKVKVDPAEAVDDFVSRIAIVMLIMSVNFALTAGQFLVGDAVAEIMNNVQLFVMLAAVVWIAPSVWRCVVSGVHDLLVPDSYILSVFKKAAVKAFSLTYLFLIFADVVARKQSFDIPTEFYLSCALAFTTAVFSLAFFIFNRSDDEIGD